MITTILHMMFVASCCSALIGSLLIICKRQIVKMVGTIWSYYLWFIMMIPWIVVWIPINISLFNPVNLHIYSSRSLVSRSYYNITTHSYSLSDHLLFAIWMLGFLIAGIYLTFEHISFSKEIKSSAKLIARDQIDFLTENVASEYYPYIDKLRLSPLVTSPLVCHLFKSKIYLPLDFFELYSPEEQKYAIIHEIIHYQRLDLLANTVMLILNCVNWFNPILYATYNYFRTAQEIACDAQISRNLSGSEKKAYGMALLKTATNKTSQKAAMSCTWNATLQLKERFTMLKWHENLHHYTRYGVMIFLFILMFSMITPHVENDIAQLIFPKLKFISDNIYPINAKESMLIGNTELRLTDKIKIYGDQVHIRYTDETRKKIAECIIYDGVIFANDKLISFKYGKLDPNTLQFLGDQLRNIN